MGMTMREMINSVYGAYRLARFDPQGMDYLEQSPDGAIRSFWAAVVVLPAYILLVLARDGDTLTETPIGDALVIQSIAYIVGWTVFPVVMHLATKAINRKDKFAGFVSAYNWSSVIQVAIQLPVIALILTGMISEDTASGMGYGILILITAYLWFVFRTSLGISGLTAAGFVLLELFTTALVADYADWLMSLARDAAE